MRTAREGNAITSATSATTGVVLGLGDVFKSILFLFVIAQVMCRVSSMPQRGSGNVHFPNMQQQQNRPVVPVINQSQNAVNQGNSIFPDEVSSSEFQVGTTGIACDQPGMFVKAPDGCNRCFCAANRQLSNACSRVYCPSGFPSTSRQGQLLRL